MITYSYSESMDPHVSECSASGRVGATADMDDMEKRKPLALI
jgi:hypothetical protein